jgi:two-component system CheB/CheR fusion protein
MKSGNTAKNSGAVKVLNKIGSEIQVVGIGASAGGLEALKLFYKNMPGNTGLAFVVIQHLDPNHNGIMPELLHQGSNSFLFEKINLIL